MIGRTLLVACAFLFLASVAACSTAPGPLHVQLSEQSDSQAASVRVTGLSSTELGALAAATWDDSRWQELLRVKVAGSATDLPVVGSYRVQAGALVFTPRFPLDAGRNYDVRLDPSKLPEPRDATAVQTVLAVPAGPDVPLSSVATIYPSADTWPENLLRFYIHFSAPMARTTVPNLVRILDEHGDEVEEALLPSELNFWNDDQTRYTVFFDPGRVKRGILPNRKHGRALIAGHRYTVVVDAGWRDARGRTLAQEYRRTFTAVPAIEQGLDMAAWSLTPPRPGTTDPLVLKFPWSLDHSLAQRAISIELPNKTVDGTVALGEQEREWRFTPAHAWQAGSYEVRAVSILEDPAGNRVGRPFELETTADSDTKEEVKEHRREFTVR